MCKSTSDETWQKLAQVITKDPNTLTGLAAVYALYASFPPEVKLFPPEHVQMLMDNALSENARVTLGQLVYFYSSIPPDHRMCQQDMVKSLLDIFLKKPDCMEALLTFYNSQNTHGVLLPECERDLVRIAACVSGNPDCSDCSDCSVGTIVSLYNSLSPSDVESPPQLLREIVIMGSFNTSAIVPLLRIYLSLSEDERINPSASLLQILRKMAYSPTSFETLAIDCYRETRRLCAENAALRAIQSTREPLLVQRPSCLCCGEADNGAVVAVNTDVLFNLPDDCDVELGYSLDGINESTDLINLSEDSPFAKDVLSRTKDFDFPVHYRLFLEPLKFAKATEDGYFYLRIKGNDAIPQMTPIEIKKPIFPHPFA
jgi:hypothetical protein